MSRTPKGILSSLAALSVLLALLAVWDRSSLPRSVDSRPPATVNLDAEAQAKPGSRKGGGTAVRLAQRSGLPSEIGNHLSLADRMAPESKYARAGLTNLMVMLSVSDAIVSSPGLSDEEIVQQLTDQGLPSDIIRERLLNYPRGEGSITALYSRNEAIPGFNQVRKVLVDAGFEIDPTSECLLECFRFVASNSELVDFLQELQKSMLDGPAKDVYAPLVATLARDERDATQAFASIFQDRLRLRYGMTEQQTVLIAELLLNLRVHTATTKDLYLSRIPRG